MLRFFLALLLAASVSSAHAQIGPAPGGGVSSVTLNTTGGGASTGTCVSTTVINCIISTQLVTVATLTSSGNVLSTYAGQQVIGNAATAQTLTLQGITTSQYLRFVNKGAGTWTLSAGTGAINSGCVTVAQNQSADIQFDGTNWNIACGSAVTAVTQTAGDSSTLIATDAFVTTAVNNAIAGVNPAVAVQVATTAAGDTSALTYNNGASGIGATFTGANNTAITIDGVTFTTVGQRLLVKNDTQSPSGAFNGVYSLTAVQTSITGAIFTRALDYDTPSDMNNTGAIPVTSGTVNTTTSWLLTSSITTVGTSPLTYAQFSISPTNLTNASNLTSGTLPAGRMPALTGNCTTVAGAVATTCDAPHPGYIATRWYPPGGIATATGAAETINKIYCFYGYVPKTITIESLGGRVTTGTSGNVQFAIYTDVGGVPGALLTSTGSIAIAAPGGASAATAANKQIGPGGADGGRDIWFCANSDTANTFLAVGVSFPSGQSFDIGATSLVSLLSSSTFVSFGYSCAGANCQGGSSTFNTWPANLNTSTFTIETSGVIPAIMFQVASSP